MADQPDEPKDLTDLPPPSTCNVTQNTAVSTSAMPFAESQKTTAPKSKAQKQRDYRHRIAAIRTPAEVITARAAETARKRNYRLRVAANSARANEKAKNVLDIEISVKDEPEWDASSIKEEERSIAEMFHSEMTVKSEPLEFELDIEEDGLPGQVQVEVQINQPKKPEDVVQIQPKIAVKKDDKLLKAFSPMQPQTGNSPMFIAPPKLVFIKTTEIRPGAPGKGQTILLTQAAAETQTNSKAPTPDRLLNKDTSPPRVLRKTAERKYGKKRQEDKDDDVEEIIPKKAKNASETEISVKDEPEWDASSIEEEERSIAEMFHSEITVKSEPLDELDIEEDELPQQNLPQGQVQVEVQINQPKKPEDVVQIQPKIAVKKDDKLLKAFSPMQPQTGNRQMFIAPPKLVFIKTTEIRPGALGKGKTILLTQVAAETQTNSKAPTPDRLLNKDKSPPRVLRKTAERKYGKKRQEDKDKDVEEIIPKKAKNASDTDISVKDEPEWDASSIEEEERSIAEMFHSEMTVKSEPLDELDI